MNSRPFRSLNLLLSASLTLVLAACAVPRATTQLAPAAIGADARLLQAVDSATDTLLAEAPRDLLEGLVGRWWPRAVMVQPMIDAGSGQQTAATQEIERRVRERIASRHPRLRLLPFAPDSVEAKPWVVVGHIAPTPAGEAARSLRLSLLQSEDGRALAHANARVEARWLDDTPLALYRDSPVLLGATSVPVPPRRLDQWRISALAEQAGAAYNAGRHAEADELYRQAAERGGANDLRTRVGLYLSALRRGDEAQARAAFSLVVSAGLRERSLGLKLLFRPGSTEYWADPVVSGAYAGWIDEIARQAATQPQCLNVVGHTSRSGAAEFNERLSLQRAVAVKQQLEGAQSALATRTHALGVGWRENLVGSGSDDTRDAIDRRVEFKVVGCG